MKHFLLPLAFAGALAFPSAGTAQSGGLDALVLSCQLDPSGCAAQLETVVQTTEWDEEELAVFLGLFAGRILELAQEAGAEEGSVYAEVLSLVARLMGPVNEDGAEAINEMADNLAESAGEGGPEDQVGGPEDQVGGPEDQVGGPEDQVGGPEDQVGGPEDQVGGPEDQVGGPEDQVGGPEDQVGGPEDQVGGPEDQPEEASNE